MKQFQYTRPKQTPAALEAIRKGNASHFLAGGTNLLDLMKRGVAVPEKLVDINRLPLKDIEYRDGTLMIGALALNSQVADHELVSAKFPLLSQALLSGASAQIRNMATVGGNMMQRTRCHYFYHVSMPCNKRQPGSGCGAREGVNRSHAIFGASEQCIAVHPSDMCVALAALDASVRIRGLKGERTLPFVDFHRLPGNEPEKDTVLAPDELILGVDIPDNPFAEHSCYLKVRDRHSYAFALVSVAAALDINNNTIQEARLAMGGVAHKPWRLYEAEKALQGKPLNEASFNAAAETALQNAQAYEHNAYKLTLASNTIVQALKEAAGLA